MRRAWPWIVLVSVTGAVLSPLVVPPASEAYPVSEYRMFASDRPRLSTVATAYALDPKGVRLTLSPELIADTDERILATTTVRRAIADGEAGVSRLCREIAGRVAGSDARPRAIDVVVVTDRYDAVDYFAGSTEPLDGIEHGRCPVSER